MASKKLLKTPDEIYADDLAQLAREHPSDPHIAALAAAAHLQLVPWDYLEPNATWSGPDALIRSEESLLSKLRPSAQAAYSLLSKALLASKEGAAGGENLLALHLDVHLREMFPAEHVAPGVRDAVFGVGSAERLFRLFRDTRMPLGMGHLVHMYVPPLVFSLLFLRLLLFLYLNMHTSKHQVSATYILL